MILPLVFVSLLNTSVINSCRCVVPAAGENLLNIVLKSSTIMASAKYGNPFGGRGMY